MTAVDPFIGGALFALGLTFGSFLNVCIYRLPRDLSVVRPGSACPKCGSGLRFYDNVPVVSWLLLAGRCRRCKASITPRYLIVELLTGAIFLACYASFGLTIAMVKYCIFGFLLLGLIFNVLNFENGYGLISLSSYWETVIRGAFLFVVVILQNRLALRKRLQQTYSAG